MNKGIVLALISLIILSIIIPVPNTALKYGMRQKLSNVDASFRGEHGGDQAGYSVAGAGDVNGDGYDDILIGAPLNSKDKVASGKTYLFFGKASGWTRDINLSKADASFVGENATDVSGDAVAGAGDVNGDGYDDILIGVSQNNDSAIRVGQTYLIFGKPSGWTLNFSLSNADASFRGEKSYDQSGISIAGAGDVNGDGFDDILIGSSDNSDNGNWGAGKTYLIFGKASGWTMETSLSKADASFRGEYSPDGSGTSIAGAGDVNGDGFDDILIGAPYNCDGGTSAGQSYLILGKTSGWARNTSLSKADASFWGEYADDQSGRSVAGAGDVNGDGYDDILIGAHQNDAGGINAGQTYLIFGKTSGWVMDTDLSKADASFWGENKDDDSGYAVASAGDVNGDGFNDIIIGANSNSDGGTFAGQTYLILGKASGWAMDIDLSSADASFIGEHAIDNSGWSIACAGDVNGDGYDDILIGAPLNDEVGNNAGEAYLVFVDINSKPISINSVKAYSDWNYSTVIDHAFVNDTVYIELRGTDGNSSRIDIAVVNVTSNASDPLGFQLRSRETGKNTGIYRGNFTIKNKTNAVFHWINASDGETVRISSFQDPSKYAKLLVKNIRLYPLDDNKVAQEDILYKEHYSTVGVPSVKWTLETNASWLIWNSTTHDISGIPDNGDVGKYFVRINASDIRDVSDEHNFTLIVKNTPPKITTINTKNALEDHQYLVDYNSTDDGQGKITWQLRTNASWLTIDPKTGIVSGIPTNDQVGRYFVNISVDDGNGGWDGTNFTLTVVDVNDPPIITMTDVTTAKEDIPYIVGYTAVDSDHIPQLLTCKLYSNASWLIIDSKTGNLTGIPKNDDVGWYWVNVTVDDGRGGQDHHNFTLTVEDVNNPPMITTQDVMTATQDIQYRVKYNASDVDRVPQVMTWTLVTNANWLHLDARTGLLNGTPRNADVGTYNVNITVSDGRGGTDSHEFKLTVININDPPVFTSIPIITAQVGVKYIYDVNATDIDIGDSLTFKLSTNPAGMVIDARTGLIEWTPTKDQDGQQAVIVEVSDGKASVKQAFNIMVSLYNGLIVNPILNQTIKVGEPWTYHVMTSNTNTSNKLTYTFEKSPNGMKIDASGIIKWTPTKDQIGEHVIILKVTNGKDQVINRFKVTVKPKDGSNQYGLFNASLFWIVLFGIIIIVIILVFIFIIKIKRNAKK